MTLRTERAERAERRVERNAQLVHVRFEGQSWRVLASQLRLDNRPGDEQVKRAVARYLDVPAARLESYVVERHQNGNVTVRPEAVFG